MIYIMINVCTNLFNAVRTSLGAVTPLADAAAATSARSQASQPSHLETPGISVFEYSVSGHRFSSKTHGVTQHQPKRGEGGHCFGTHRVEDFGGPTFFI